MLFLPPVVSLIPYHIFASHTAAFSSLQHISFGLQISFAEELLDLFRLHGLLPICSPWQLKQTKAKAADAFN